MKENYVIDHNMYLMNHKNGDVLKVTVNKKNPSLKNLRLYRQDGFGNYYYVKHSKLKNCNNLSTKKDVIKASKEIGGHNTHHIDNWHHKVEPVYNADHKITDFEPKLAIAHHTKVKNAKRYLRHLSHHHANFLFLANKGLLKKPYYQLKDAIYTDRNKEVVIAHKLHKVAK